ncbi:hypothetical protein V6N12_050224 [Hibiscus sabdariffa]|uniref:C2 NT-type domain-containing protein n=1 Tax=Hibiscus sabdariffa TaxID=183260 RepID=A0ABR2GBU9_9ROSI
MGQVVFVDYRNGEWETMAKMSKAVVRNGICQWTKTLSESIWVPKIEAEDCLFKLLVATGSARSSILGEATVNMACYLNSTAIVPVLLPLKKMQPWDSFAGLAMDYFKDNEPKQTSSQEGNNTEHPPDLSLSSDDMENLTAKTTESSPRPDFVLAPFQEEFVNREASFSASDSHCSYDSTESCIGRKRSSPLSNLNGEMEKQDAPTSHSDPSSFVSQSSSSDNK